jgi:hypothetical protein
LIGNTTFSGRDESGSRFTIGKWLDDDSSCEISYFSVSQGSGVAISSGGNLVLGRPFFNITTGAEDAVAVALPAQVTGGVLVQEDSRLWGGEATSRRRLCCGENYQVQGLVGLRYMELVEGLSVIENQSILPTVPVIGGLGANSIDQFGTRNRLYMGQFGLEVEWGCGCFFVNARAKLAMGAGVEEATIAGRTTTTATPPGTFVNGSFLALPTNIGSQQRTDFVLASEFGLNVGCVILECMRVSLGYNVLGLSDVLRPGNQIDRVINPAQLTPGSFGGIGPAVPPRPSFTFRDSAFWVQGLTATLEVRF